MSVGLAWTSAAKSNEKLDNQKYATLFLSWMPFSENFDPETCTNHIYTILKSNGVIVLTLNLVIICSENNLMGMVWAN